MQELAFANVLEALGDQPHAVIQHEDAGRVRCASDHADDPSLMDRMLRLWDLHLVERRAPAVLPPLLRDAGFAVGAITPEFYHDTRSEPTGWYEWWHI